MYSVLNALLTRVHSSFPIPHHPLKLNTIAPKAKHTIITDDTVRSEIIQCLNNLRTSVSRESLSGQVGLFKHINNVKALLNPPMNSEGGKDIDVARLRRELTGMKDAMAEIWGARESIEELLLYEENLKEKIYVLRLEGSEYENFDNPGTYM